MKRLGIVLLIMFFAFCSVSMAEFTSLSSNNGLGLKDSVSSLGSSSNLGLKDSVTSLGSSLYTMVLIVNAIVYLGIPAIIALLFCAIKAKKEDGFGNSFKKSFLKVFLITLGVIIVFEILINVIL